MGTNYKNVVQKLDLFRNANNTTSYPRSRISIQLRIRMFSEPQVIRAPMKDNCTPDDAMWANKSDQLIGYRICSVPLSVDIDIPEISDMAYGSGSVAVGLAGGVEVAASRGAAIRVVAILVDVEAAQSGLATLNIVLDACRRTLGLLCERHSPSHTGCTTQNGHSRDHLF